MKKKVLAVASGGGHWVQLMRIKPSFEGHIVRYVSTRPGLQKDVDEKLYCVTDASSWEKFKAIRMFLEMFWVVVRFRPNVIISTGALLGFSAVFWGRLFGCKTIWLDSIANAGELSSAGKHAGRYSSVWLTQWSHLEKENGPVFKGRVL